MPRPTWRSVAHPRRSLRSCWSWIRAAALIPQKSRGAPAHERVIADGDVARLGGDLLHTSAESLDAYIDKQNRYSSLQAAALHARGDRAGAIRIALSPLARFLRFYVVKLGFLDGVAGF